MSEQQDNKETKEAVSTEIAIIDERTIHDKIYVVRGVQVMLDFELAEIYGYSTKRFNEQVKNNVTKFDEDFRFQLTKEEVEELSRSKKSTLNRGEGRGSNFKYLPWAFTESGIYMLMTVLKGELAIRQSKALIRTFRAMKEYIVQNQTLIGQRDYLHLSMQVSDTQQAVQSIQNQLISQGDKLNDLFNQMQDTVRKSEISPFLLDFSKPNEQREYLILNGQLVKADVTYIDIYNQAKRSVHIVDDYINIKTLYLLQDVKPGVMVTIFSDNNYNKLHANDYADFQRQFPKIPIDFIQTQKAFHDRFIVLDYDSEDERVFHCGGSSKDGGNKLMVITELTEGFVKDGIHGEIKRMLSNNPQLILS